MTMLIQRVNILCSTVLHISIDRLNYIIANIEKFYIEYQKPKRDKNGAKRLNKPQYQERYGKYWSRTINPPHEELKNIQKCINGYLVNNIPMPDFAFGGVKEKDNILNAKQHKGQKYVFQTDLTDFYPFISCKRVYEMFVRVGFSADVASKLTKLTTFKGHLPQGAPTSTTIANLVFEPTGRKLQALSVEYKLRMTTFVDDVTISSQYQFKDITPEMIKILEEDGFRISQNKTSYKSGIAEITGVRSLNNSMTTTRKFKAKYAQKSSLPESTIRGMEQYQRRVKSISDSK